MPGMTPIGNTGVYRYGFQTGSNGGVVNREDLLPVIYNIAPFDTPLGASAPSVTAQHVVHEWLNDTLDAAETTGAVEGADWALDTVTTPTRILNITQIFRKDLGVPETQRAVNPAGFKDAYAYEVQKKFKALARNLEKTSFSSQASSTGSSGSARQMKTLQTLISTNVNGPATLTTPGDATHAGIVGANDVNSILQTIFEAGGDPETIHCSASLKRQFSAFSISNQTRYIGAMEKKLTFGIDVLDTDFGLKQVILNRWVPQATNTGTATATALDVSGQVFFLQRAMVRYAWLRPMAHTLIGKRGDSVAGLVVGEVTIEVLNELSCGRITGVNNKSAVS